MDRWKAEMGGVREEKTRTKRKSQKKEDQGERKDGKVAKHCVFPMICGSEGRKVGSPKRRVRSQLARWEMKSCTPLWREAHLQVKKLKAPHVRSTFGSCDVEKVHAVVARSTFRSQNVKNTRGLDHFWKLRCRKSARRCGAKHVSKSKCTKHLSFGALLEVEMSKKCTPLWREAHFEAKMLKTPGVWTTFGSWDVEKVHAVVARSTFASEKAKNTARSEHFWKLRCRKSARRCGAKHISKLRCRKSARRCGAKHVSKSKCAKHQKFGPLLEVQVPFRVAGARDCAPCQKWEKREGFVAFPKSMAGVGHLKRICKDAFSVAGAVQETSSSELLGGPGADFLRRVAFWSIRSSGLLKWFCVTGAALRITWHHFFVAGAVV